MGRMGGIGEQELAELSVGTSKIKLLAIITGLIADLAVTTAKLAAGAVTWAKTSDFPKARSHFSGAAQNLPRITVTPVNLATTDWDTHAGITATAPWTYTCRRTGKYHFSGSIGYAPANIGTTVFVTVLKNGGEYARGMRFGPNGFAGGHVSTDIDLVLNDTVQLALYHDSANATEPTETSGVVCHASIHMLPGD